MEADLMTGILSLPYDAITLILMKLSMHDLGRAASINKLFDKLSNQNLVWKHRYFVDYKIRSLNYEGSWKDLYKKMQPMINLKNKSFVYRATSKSFRMPRQNATLMADWHSSQNVAVVHWTQYNRGSYAENELLSTELMDLNNLSYTPIKSTLPRMTYIPVGNYFAGFRKSGVGTGTVYIFKRELDLPATPLYVLRREQDGRRPNLSTEGKYLMHYSVTLNRTMDIGTHVSAKIYDFDASGDTPISDFSFNGNVWQFTEDYIIHTSTGDYSKEVRVFEWRKVKGVVSSKNDDMVFLNDHTIKCVAIHDHKLLCYSAEGPCYLTLWDIKTQQKIKQFATFPLVKCLGVSLAYIDNFCYIGLKRSQDVWKHAFFDLDREDLVRVFELDGEFSSILPLEDENNRFSGKFLVTTTENDGILDLCHPLMSHTFDVLLVPPTLGNISSLDASALPRRSVTFGQMVAAFVDICQCPSSLFLDSHVVFLEPKKKRYTLIFNGKHVSEPSPIVTDFVRKSSIEHYRNTPVQGLEFGLDPAKKPQAPRFVWRRNNPDSPSAAGLTVYGPCVLMKEVWTDAHGFVPKSVGKKALVKVFAAQVTRD